jgi:hypothetical protein
MIIDMRGLRARMFVNLLHGICMKSKNVCEFVT